MSENVKRIRVEITNDDLVNATNCNASFYRRPFEAALYRMTRRYFTVNFITGTAYTNPVENHYMHLKLSKKFLNVLRRWNSGKNS